MFIFPNCEWCIAFYYYLLIFALCGESYSHCLLSHSSILLSCLRAHFVICSSSYCSITFLLPVVFSSTVKRLSGNPYLTIWDNIFLFFLLLFLAYWMYLFLFQYLFRSRCHKFPSSVKTLHGYLNLCTSFMFRLQIRNSHLGLFRLVETIHSYSWWLSLQFIKYVRREYIKYSIKICSEAR